jgi:hypothetical protein
MKRQTLNQGDLTLIVKAENDDDSPLRKLLLGYLAECNCTGIINATRMGKQRGTKSPNPVRVSRGLNYATIKVEDKAEYCFEYRVYPPNRMSLDTFMQMVLKNDSRKNHGGITLISTKNPETSIVNPAPQADTKVLATVAETETPAQITVNEGADPTKTDSEVPPTPIETGTKKSFDLKEFFGDSEQMDVLILSLKELFEKHPFVPTSELTKFLVNLLQCEPNQMAPIYAKLARLPNGFHLEHDSHDGIQGYKAAYFDRERTRQKLSESTGDDPDTDLETIVRSLKEIENQLITQADEIHRLIESVRAFGPRFKRLTELEGVMKTLQGALPK